MVLLLRQSAWPQHGQALFVARSLALRFLHQHGAITNQQYRELTGFSESTALRDLERLVKLGRYSGVLKECAFLATLALAIPACLSVEHGAQRSLFGVSVVRRRLMAPDEPEKWPSGAMRLEPAGMNRRSSSRGT